MRVAVYIVMVGLVVSAVAAGEIGIALVAAGAKTALVGLEYMELRHAARPHAIGFVFGAVALTGLLAALTASG